jgi:hypothetical protein
LHVRKQKFEQESESTIMRVMWGLRIVIVLGAMLLAGGQAAAQTQALLDPQLLMEPENGSETRRFVWRPAIELVNLGWDSNLFNLPDEDRPPQDEIPRGDFVTSVAAGLAPIWSPGNVRIAAAGGLGYNYYHRFEKERGFDLGARGRIEVPVSRARLHAGSSYFDLRQRLNYEVDVRARRTERDVDGGIDLGLGARTRLDVRARRYEVLFDEDAPEVQYVRDALNREERTLGASLEYALTPFTNLVVTGERGVHRFPLSPLRNGDSDAVLAGLSLSSDAVVSGRAMFGWRRLTVVNPLMPAYSGLTANVDANTVLGVSTRLAVRGRRDVTFSVGEAAPYYVQTLAGASLMQALGERWDTGIRFDRVLLDYVQPLIVTGDRYREYIDVFGGTVGFRFPGGFRISLEGELMRRSASIAPNRSYQTVRFYTVISSRALRF